MTQIAHKETYTDEVIERYLQEEVLDGGRQFDHREFRLSQTGHCARKRVLQALGVEPDRGHDLTDAEYFERGNLLEKWLKDVYTDLYPRRLRREVPVDTGLGATGHIDLWWSHRERIIEIKSIGERVVRSQLPKPDHVAQVQAYLHFFTDYRGYRRTTDAEIVYGFYGRKLEWEAYPISYDPEWGQSIEEELEQLIQMRDRGEVPDIPDEHEPQSFPCFWMVREGEQFCPHYSHCWGGPKEEEVEPEEDPALYDLFREYQQVASAYTDVNRDRRKLKKDKKRLETALARMFELREAEQIRAGDIQLKAVDMPGKTYWKPKKAYEQGLIGDEDLEAIRSVSSESDGYTRWYIKEVDTEDGPDKG